MITDENSKSLPSIELEILHEEADEANSLVDEASILFKAMFESKNLEKNKDDHVLLLKRLLDFEGNLINVPILNYLFATIARVCLNSHDYKNAIKYAQAGIEVNLKQSDAQGVRVNNVVILDTACMMGAHKEAIKLFDKSPNIADESVKNMLQNMPSDSDADAIFQKMLKSTKRPKSLVLCLNEQLWHEEKPLKTLMRMMDISRSEALKYKAAADNLADSNYEPE
ncbi:hypothetical protein [Moritella sp. F3]|uniref:hypothetical protein n=1 Tax=Moritella sp. F3 TaxID=2718882 RepID=UPI0018E0C930|nr:hypothetical protein [Moritella sp. F3]GIC77164.1 hypothetical protein FMO001_18910 [Moritella sp. F1]GIC82283.1 hypothetical protein FMO003_25640 [Moritella sp. F3]